MSIEVHARLNVSEVDSNALVLDIRVQGPNDEKAGSRITVPEDYLKSHFDVIMERTKAELKRCLERGVR